MNKNLHKIILDLPEGYSKALYNGLNYGITKDVFNSGKSIKIYAKELSGNDFISLNYYITQKNPLVKPCEMEEKKVIDFLVNMKIEKTN